MKHDIGQCYLVIIYFNGNLTDEGDSEHRFSYTIRTQAIDLPSTRLCELTSRLTYE